MPMPPDATRSEDARAESARAETDGARRRFMKVVAGSAMTGGLASGYGVFAVYAGRFLYPAESAARRWQFVTTLDRLPAGAALNYVTPGGAKVVITRQGEGELAEDFRALSSVCPHLGCQVHWEPQNDRFFCPCHNGVFNPQGVATSGPPAEAHQRLTAFPLKVEAGLLYIEVPMESIPSPQQERRA